MTSQSPRIYTYKITFEEVPYYYYGVHKEKVFGEEYCGSPKTNKWCWELYTPKKQILQLFDFTDEGWLEAQEVEKRLIRPFFNTDKWCLNESCGGKTSLKVLRETGKKCGHIGGAISGKLTYERGIGIHAQTPEEKLEAIRKSHETQKTLNIGLWGMTNERKSEVGKIGGNKVKELKLGIFSLTKDERVKIAKETYKKTGIGKMTKEERTETARKVNSQKWMCLETGFVTNAGALTSYQKKRGIDTSKRVRIS